MLGSFMGLVIDRVPAGESIVHGRSHCPACGRTLDAVDLVPIAGYALRGGRCAGCRVAIPARYPLLEAGSAALMAGPVLLAGPVLGGLLGLGLLAVLTALGLAAGRR